MSNVLGELAIKRQQHILKLLKEKPMYSDDILADERFKALCPEEYPSHAWVRCALLDLKKAGVIELSDNRGGGLDFS